MACGGGVVVYRCFLVAAGVAVLALVVLLVTQYKHPTPPRYYASIVSVSGVGVDEWQQQGQRMQFNLALGVESRSPLWGSACLERGTAVEVAYHGVALAYGATGKEVCAGPWKLWSVRKTTVVAAQRTSGVGGLPEFVVEGLLADSLRGVQVFDVKFRTPSTRQDGAGGDDDGKLASCMACLVGSEKADACDVHYS